jgi:hypothetical protein
LHVGMGEVLRSQREGPGKEYRDDRSEAHRLRERGWRAELDGWRGIPFRMRF